MVDVTKLRVGFVVVSPDVRGDDNEPSDVVEISPVSTVGLPDPQPRLLDQTVCSGSTSVPLSTIDEEEGEDMDNGSDNSADRVRHDGVVVLARSMFHSLIDTGAKMT